MLDSMTLKQAVAIAGTLGFPSKMPGTSYGISAHACHIGAKLAQIEGSVCHGCYALKANYLYPSVLTAHEKRLAGLSHPSWAIAVAVQLRAAHKLPRKRKKTKRQVKRDGINYHRWHDSGDLQSEQHLAKICVVAALTPEIAHWLPTRELAIVQRYLAAGGTVPPNLTIRVSATMVDGPATKAWTITSGVHGTGRNAKGQFRPRPPKATHYCPSPKQANTCGACRACWSADVAHVSYHKH